MKLKRFLLPIAALFFAVTAWAQQPKSANQATATQQLNASLYVTSAAAGVEKDAVITTPFFQFCGASVVNYDAANPKVIMLFDATTLPATGTVPTLGSFVVVAATATTPAQASFTVDQCVTLKNGIVIAASSTGKTLTLDSGANTAFNVGYR